MNDLIKQEQPPAPVKITEDIQVSLNRLGRELETHAESGIRIGKELLHLKDITPHGKFGELVEWAYPNFKHAMRENYMNVARKYGQNPNLLGFSNTVLIELSRPSVPEAAREEAQELAEAGSPVTVAKAKEIVADHKEIEELRAELEESKAKLKRSSENNAKLLEKLTEAKASEPKTYPLISNIQELLGKGEIMPAKAKALQTLTAEGQSDWYSLYVAKFSLENQLIEKSAKIKELEAKASTEPQIIEKIVKVEVEKIPDDYEKLKKQIDDLNKTIKTKKEQLEKETKDKEEIRALKNSIEESLIKKLDKANDELNRFDVKKREIKASQDLAEASKLIDRAYAFFTDEKGIAITGFTSTILLTAEAIKRKLELFERRIDDGIIDIN